MKIVSTILTYSAFAAVTFAPSASWAVGSSSRNIQQYGLATYYGHSAALTAAHRTLPFGTRVRVTNRQNGRAVIVTINDHGPAPWTGRLIDVSFGAARALNILRSGVASVHLETVR